MFGRRSKWARMLTKQGMTARRRCLSPLKMATLVRVLLEWGADVNKAMDKGATPLFIAAQNGHETVIRSLIEFGAEVNKAKDDGATPLFMATQKGHRAVVRALIEFGADVNKARDDGATPLLMAAQNGQLCGC